MSIADLTNQLENASLEDSPYEKAREHTFLRYYKQLFDKLTTEHFAMLQDALLNSDAELREDILKKAYGIGILDMFYDTNKSITQSLRSQAGRSLETLVEHNLLRMDISFAKQVFVKDNIVCKKKSKGGHVLDCG